jgi:hypothetical protein
MHSHSHLCIDSDVPSSPFDLFMVIHWTFNKDYLIFKKIAIIVYIRIGGRSSSVAEVAFKAQCE